MLNKKLAYISRLKRRLLNQIFPWNRCLLCGQSLVTGLKMINYQSNHGYVCPDCLHNLKNYKACDKCSNFVPLEQEVCSWCQQRHLSWLTDCVAFAPYADGLRKYILDLKFYDKQGLARPMGEMVAKVVKEKQWDIQAVTAVPLHKNRLQQRGYNQSKLIALNVADHLGVPYIDDMIIRVKDTKAQSKLTYEQRRDNLREAFGAGANGGLAHGKSILLIDDVITSGNTMENCSKALKKLGALKVYGASVAGALERPAAKNNIKNNTN